MSDTPRHTPAPQPLTEQNEATTQKPRRKHLIKPTWLRRTLKTLLGILIFILLLPVLVYIPIVQDWLVDAACSITSRATGMSVSIDKFRLKFPLDVQLDGVLILTESGDTMVQARSLVADVQMLPLLHLDAQINRVQLLDGKYMMLSEDSSMTMRLKAGLLEFEHGSAVNLKSSSIKLHNPHLKDADIRVDIDVWKQVPDSVKTPTEWIIKADKMQLENVRYSMSMLPTIKELDLTIGRGTLTDALIDLKHYRITAADIDISGSRAKYIVPTPHYIATHPEPIDTISPPTPPYTIQLGKAHLGFDYALYATDSVQPQSGFDPSYIEVRDAVIGLNDFYNRATDVRLPITSIQATERSGLQLTSGSGVVAIDSIGIALQSLQATTPHSELRADAIIPYTFMEMDPSAVISVQADGSLGWQDIYSYMPSLQPMLSKIPNRDPLVFSINADGSLSKLILHSLRLSIARFLSLKASGVVEHLTDFDKMSAAVTLDGSVSDAGVINRLCAPMLKPMGISIPTFAIKGDISLGNQCYKANVQLRSSAGDASLDGSVSLSAESYDVDASLHQFDLSAIMPSLGVGLLTGSVSAHGAGFNPMDKGASTDIYADMQTLVYGRHNLAPLTLDATLHHGTFDIELDGHNPDMDLWLTTNGNLSGSNLQLDLDADIAHLDLYRLGFVDTPCAGAATFALSGTANIDTYYCDMQGSVQHLDWIYGSDIYQIENLFEGSLYNDAHSTALGIYGDGVDIEFDAASPLRHLINELPTVVDLIMAQVQKRDINAETISERLPVFTLSLDANSTGLLSHFLADTDYTFDSLHLNLAHDSLIYGDMRLLGAGNSSLTLDTVTLSLQQRSKLLDYKLHIGNTAQNLPDFASINMSGYVGMNRASAFLRQRDIQGMEGYRLGLTAAMLDSVINLHLTPLDATIAYKPWSINDDNYIQIGPGSRIQADLTAKGGNSSIRLSTPERTDTLQALNVQIANLHIEDFLQMSALAPPLSGELNTDLTLVYRGNAITGTGSMGIKDFAYDKQRIGDLDFDIKGGMGFTGNTGGKIAMLYNGREVLEARGYMITDTLAQGARGRNIKNTTAFELELKQLPLSIANPFMPAEYMQLCGNLNGVMRLTGSLTAPVLNGSLSSDSAGVRVPMASTTLYMESGKPITVEDNILKFDHYNIYAANDNPVSITGSVDAHNLTDMAIDLSLAGSDVALINSKKSSSEIYGKLFTNINATARGRLSHLYIDASLSVLPATDIFYTYLSSTGALQDASTTDVVKFVQLSDSTLTAVADTTLTPPMNMDINATLSVVNGAKATVLLSNNGTDKVTLTPYGTLSYTQDFMGDMRLNGSLYLGTGFARYSVPVIGEKTFNFNPGSYVNWSGDIMNPTLNIFATDRVKANVQQEGVNSRLIYFDVGLSVLGTLSAPKVAFDLSTDDDMTVQNELLSMSAEQRSASAMNLLLYNTYTGPGIKANANLSNPLYSFLEGQLNSWAAKNIKGVDLSFGIDSYKQTIDGVQDNTTSYSYQVSKSLFDNRFKIIVGGNYSTDAQADENFAENLISDISFEYSLRQSTNTDMYLRLFRHTGFESILEGEVTETGVGFALKRKLSTLRNIFRLRGRRKKTDKEQSSQPDTITAPHDSLIPLSNDSIISTPDL